MRGRKARAWAPAAVGAALLMGAAGPALAQRIPVPEAPGVSMVLIPVPAGADVASALPKVIEKTAASQGGIAQHSTPSQINAGGVPVRLEAVSFNSSPGTVFFFLSVPQGRGICMAAMPFAQVKTVAKPVTSACLGAIRGGAGPAPGLSANRPASGGMARPTPVASRPGKLAAAPNAHPENWANVEGVYFRNLPSFGVGGMFIMKFAPLILFKDGGYYEIDDAPLEDIDLAAAHAQRPRDWGRWTQQGGRYVLTDDKGHANDYQLQKGNFFKAFPASGTGSLTGGYKNLSGGGNTALGGDVMIASQNTLIFMPGGVYSTDRSTGATNNGQYTGVASTVSARGGGQGKFSVDRYTITLQKPDGRTERSFFAFSSQGSPPRIDKDMIFIGTSVYSPNR